MVATSFQLDRNARPYGVKIDIFEGPLDLLLFLIRKEEVDIYDIPIANITRQFLEYVEVIQGLNLEQAGDFVLMAATLMKIKSQMLLPVDPEEEEETEDPREELVRRLLEYQQFKEVAGWMEDQQEANRDLYYRGTAVDLEAIQDLEADAREGFQPIGLFELLKAFKQAMDMAPKIDFHAIERVEVTTEERIEFVMDVLTRRDQVPFTDLISGHRIVVVVTFVAILELMKEGQLTVQQATSDGEIWVYRNEKRVVPNQESEYNG
jgi:segregation and condensation protein A